ncbi:hypothetical protein Tco_0681318, partial [Tanacetum coccineum]
MSDSEDSMVTYTEVSSPYEGLPWMLDDPYVQVVLQAPPSPDYVPGPKEPEQAPPLPDLVLETVYPEFMPPEDEVLPAEEQPLPIAASPTADFTQGGLREEEHPSPAESTTFAFLAVEHAPSAEETEPFKTDESAATPPPHPAYRVTARISIQDEPLTPFWSDTEVADSLLYLLHHHHHFPHGHHHYFRFPYHHYQYHHHHLLVLLIYLGYRAAMIRLRVEAPSTSYSPPPHIILSHTRADASPSGTPPLLPIPLPTSSPPLHILSIDHRADRPDVTLPHRKRSGIALGPRYEVGESSSAPTARPLGG